LILINCDRGMRHFAAVDACAICEFSWIKSRFSLAL